MSELKPCPFCGNDAPRMVRHMDESLWSHAAVEWLHITCDECDCESVSSEVHEDVIAAWNRRAAVIQNTAVDERMAAQNSESVDGYVQGGGAAVGGDAQQENPENDLTPEQEAFCTGHCCWSGHHKDCPRYDPPSGVTGTSEGRPE